MPAMRPDAYELTPWDDIELVDLRVRHAELDEVATMEDPDEHPKPPHANEEPVTDEVGEIFSLDLDGLEDHLIEM